MMNSRQSSLLVAVVIAVGFFALTSCSRPQPVMVKLADVQITIAPSAVGATDCVASPGAYIFDSPAGGVAVVWTATQGYHVNFAPYQNPSDPNNANPTFVNVQNGNPGRIVISNDAQTACTGKHGCTYPYTITPSDAGTCEANPGSFGIIVKP